MEFEPGSHFEAEILYYFSIATELKYRFWVIKKLKYVPCIIEACDRRRVSGGHVAKLTPPPYVVGIVSELINLKEIPKSFNFRLQYVGTDFDCNDLPTKIAISYDVVFAGGRALRSATFEVFENQDFLQDQLLPIFTKLSDKKISNVMEIPSAWRSAGFIDHEVDVLGYDNSKDGEVVLKARCTTCFRRHPYGEYASAYILPRFPSSRFPSSNDSKMSTVVLAGCDCGQSKGSPAAMGECLDPPKVRNRALSRVVQQNLEALELGMSAPNPKVVFVQGDPGSGKEGFANAIHNGSRLDRGGPDKASARSIAGMDLSQFRREVFGEERDGVPIHGLIDKASGGTIFLDEFDKLDEGAEGAYAELLRVWEAKEFVPLNGRLVRQVGRINWVVAGAFTSKRTTSDLPPDIWSRFSAQIAIQNPISSRFVRDGDRSHYIQALILNFMLELAIQKAERDGLGRSIRALCIPESRIHGVVGQLLFHGDRGKNGVRLEPSELMILIANALTQYLGIYCVCSVKSRRDIADDQKPKEYCLPRQYVEQLRASELRRLLMKEHIDDPRLKSHLLQLITPMNKLECYDSIRAIRQACRVVFDRMFELLLQKATTTSAVKGEQIQKLLNEAFTTIDLTRQGNGLERLLDQDSLRCVRFGARGIVPQSLVEQIAAKAQEV